jgi:membrane protein required for colicin V production
MQPYDLVMLVVLGSATLFGFWKGLAWQIASLASLVVSYFVALRFADRIAPMVSAHEPWNKFVAMLIIYAAASLVIWMLFRVVSGVIDRVKLNEFDRQMGALVGFAKGVLLCIAITFFAVTLLGQQQRDRIIASRSGQYIVRLLDKADAVAPPEIHQVIGPYIQKINERLDPNYQPNPAGDLQNLQQMWQQQAGGGAATTGGGWPPAGSASTIWPTTADGSSRPAGQAQTWPSGSGGQRR